MVKYDNIWQDGLDKECMNGDEEWDVEVKGQVTRAIGGTFIVYILASEHA